MPFISYSHRFSQNMNRIVIKEEEGSIDKSVLLKLEQGNVTQKVV